MLKVYPACAGIDPQPGQSPHHGSSLPRMRGDRPWSALEIFWSPRFTPHARGSTGKQKQENKEDDVYPACAGIDRGSCLTYHACLSLPRMRGDRPIAPSCRLSMKLFTPHARGSTETSGSCWSRYPVYPACAGIDLYHVRIGVVADSLPRMRGDRPAQHLGLKQEIQFTPHARGSTAHVRELLLQHNVYPACAGIDPHTAPSAAVRTSLPRMRGDRPEWYTPMEYIEAFTPHARGSTEARRHQSIWQKVYPACAGIDPPSPSNGSG